jgi:hypothetical protein
LHTCTVTYVASFVPMMFTVTYMTDVMTPSVTFAEQHVPQESTHSTTVLTPHVTSVITFATLTDLLTNMTAAPTPHVTYVEEIVWQ